MKKPSKTPSRGEDGGQAITLTSAKRGFLSPAKFRVSGGRAVTVSTVITACPELKAKMREDAVRGTLSLCSRSGN